MKYFILFITTSFFLSSTFAFDIETIDETEEGIIKSKRNEIADDGKTIYKPIEPTIIKPMKLTIVQGYKPIIKPVKRKIIYPIGAIPPKPVESRESEQEPIKKTNEENIFLSKEELEKNKNASQINTIKYDDDFKKNSSSTINEKENKARKIPPVNIE